MTGIDRCANHAHQNQIDSIKELFVDYPNFIYNIYDCEFGITLTFMTKLGEGCCAINISDYEGNSDMYVHLISVKDEYRGLKIGRQILLLCKLIALTLDQRIITLCAKQGTWVYDWYVRNGFKVSHTNEDDDTYDVLKCDIYG